MSTTPETILCSISVEQARAILATEPVGTERYALANSIVSLSAANQSLEQYCKALEQTLDECVAQLKAVGTLPQLLNEN